MYTTYGLQYKSLISKGRQILFRHFWNPDNRTPTSAPGCYAIVFCLLALAAPAQAQSYGPHSLSNSHYAIAPGPGDSACLPHDSDYLGGADWAVTLSELLRAVQPHQAGGYTSCLDGEDGFCVSEE